MTSVVTIGSYGFIRGAIVRHKGIGPNMLVVRGLGPTTAVIVCEGDAGGTLRVREYETRELKQVLPASDYLDRPPTDLMEGTVLECLKRRLRILEEHIAKLEANAPESPGAVPFR